MDEVNNASLLLEEALKDPMRVDYYNSHLSFLQIAMKWVFLLSKELCYNVDMIEK